MENQKTGWIDEIAAKSKYSVEQVKSVIQKYDIQQSPNIGMPKHLHIKEVKFSGVKDGIFSNEFNFNFGNLKPGIYGLFSDNNLRGKTTALEVIKWLLRGSSSGKLQEGVKNWIHKASIVFEIDSELYKVILNNSKNEVSGELLNISVIEKKQLCVFYSDDEFESCMSEFMIKQFSLDKISAFRNSRIQEKVGKKVNHNWSSLASALFISTDYSSLFGDNNTDGLSNRLMNMYLGLPWFSTYIKLKTLESQIKSENKVDDIYLNKELERKKKRFQEIELELKDKQELIKKFPSTKDTREKLSLSRENYGKISRELTSLDKTLRKQSEEFEAIRVTRQNDKIRINNFKEDMAANAIFKRLNPTCCPHCESTIDKIKIEKEKTSHQCAICDSPLLESEDAEVLLDELKTNLKASEKAYTAINREYNQNKGYHSKLTSTLSS